MIKVLFMEEAGIRTLICPPLFIRGYFEKYFVASGGYPFIYNKYELRTVAERNGYKHGKS